MKTPREVLFDRHHEAGPKLDEIRRQVLAALPAAESVEASVQARGMVSSIREFLGKAWLELIWPSWRAWAGFGVIWLGVLVANLELKVSPAAVSPVEPRLARETVRSFREQQRFLTELLPPVEVPPVQAPPSGPRQRSDRSLPVKAC